MNPLSALLNLPAAKKIEEGLEFTPHEIAQQPETWLRTCAFAREREKEICEPDN